MSIFKMFFVVIVAYIGWGWSISFRHHGVAGVFAHPFEFFGLHNAVITDDRNIVDGSHGYANVIDIGFQLTFAAIATALISGANAERVKFGTWLTFVGLWVTLVYCPLVCMV
ncbi:ammonium transporter [Corynebacterium diphtheriae]|nr:ammonium transporter [Corynebacterium diphtheriae]